MAGCVDVVYFCSANFNNMRTSDNIIIYEEPEGPDIGLPDGKFISFNLKTVIEGIVTTHPFPSSFYDIKPCLFEGCGGFSTVSYTPHVEMEHDSTWDDFGRAYYSSCNYQYTGCHFTLYSVDELKRQIEEKLRQYAQNWIISVPCFICDTHESSILDRYFAESHWNEDLLARIDDFKARNLIERDFWMADDHSCHPFNDKYIYQHQLAKLSLSGLRQQTTATWRPCCRSFLVASCHQSSGDDLLGH